jgi:methionyl-tRNA formyltransferase
MSTKSIIFFGNEQLATGVKSTESPVFSSLLSSPHKLKALVLHADSRSRPTNIERLAHEHHIPIIKTRNLKATASQLTKLKADVGVLAAFGHMVPESVINIFKHGILNIHPSLLPRYRGPTPIEQAILDGQGNTGVSIMQLVAAMDAGPVFAQAEVSIDKSMNSAQLAESLAIKGSQLLLKTLNQLSRGKLLPKPQDDSKATYCKLISKADGRINWHKPAEQIEREIRAYYGWPGSYTQLAGRDVTITKAHVLPTNQPASKPADYEVVKETGALIIQCGKGALYVEKLKPAGKSEMSAADFSRGYLKPKS